MAQSKPQGNTGRRSWRKWKGKIGTSGEPVLLGYKKFSGDCRYCGKRGHKAADCYKKKGDEKSKTEGYKGKKNFNGTCHKCGKKGHKKADCYHLKDKAGSEEKGAVVLVATPWCIETQDVQQTKTEDMVSVDYYDTLDDLLQADQTSKMSWASICETSCDDSGWEDRDDACLDDVPDLLSDGDDSSADDNGDELQEGYEYLKDDDTDEDNSYNEDVDEFCLAIGNKDVNEDYMIADCGATIHIRKNSEGMFDLRHEQCVIKYGNGSQSTSTVNGQDISQTMG
jgi:hypothetical protein